jgi:hypothetical protein
MQGIHDLLANLDEVEVIIIRITAFLGVVMVCGSILWAHIKQLIDAHRSKKKSESESPHSKEEASPK